MNMRQLASTLVGVLVLLRHPEVRDERGLSQSAENAILLAGAVLIAGGIITALGIYVTKHLPK